LEREKDLINSSSLNLIYAVNHKGRIKIIRKKELSKYQKTRHYGDVVHVRKINIKTKKKRIREGKIQLMD
jgi:hypothetical protein